MTGIVIAIIIVGIVWLLRYLIQRDPTWIFRKILNSKLRKMQREQQKSYQKNSKNRSYSAKEDNSPSRIIPPEYGEDVEFVEIKEFSHTSFTQTDSSGTTEYSESQISDAEWIEIKK